MSQPNGADILCESLLANDIDVCFANPGTSEMHFVAALDRNPRMRCVLGLSEGVVTGAADGYARMADKPAATLLHLGPGLANGLANLHNARRARTPMVNVVGDHATYHLVHDAPLTSDIGSLARPMCDWVGKVRNAATLSADAAEAIRHAVSPPGISTLILPADCAWSPAPPQAVKRVEAIAPQRVTDEAVAKAARVLRSGARVGLLLGGRSLRQKPLAIAGSIAAVADVALLTETSNARIERGAGRVAVDRIPYPIDLAIEMLKEFDALILVGAKDPVGFFAYPGKPGRLAREDCRIVTLATPDQDLPDALSRLAEAVGGGTAQRAGIAAPHRDEGTIPDGTLSSEVIAMLVAQMMPEGSVICDEALTSARSFFSHSQHSAPHDYLAITGGAIGIGIPLATGAAVGAPGRKVIGLQADGSGMYTVQALWTQAREKLDVVTIVFANQAYRILEGELRNVGVEQAGPNARRMLELKDPAVDWVSLAKGLGVESVRVDSISAFRHAFDASLRRPGPFLIEAIV
ncbi:acetolactate synthase large subunit [Metarhizobium album]|uniref:Acetolactate synthase large subunit n=1 Tax=Metarhizobium album TaxID=2182425 RepID=A0A2U2DL99_9HYPH|nr:acetolactate synthase large subunit [Rhizobium album]PWE54069.1 acetolactate synthase large subunit [Rhizobium album]